MVKLASFGFLLVIAISHVVSEPEQDKQGYYIYHIQLYILIIFYNSYLYLSYLI